MITRIRASGLILKNNQVLVIRRVKAGEEYWLFPGGGVEKGESNLEAALREIREETSLELANIIDQKTYRDPENKNAQHFFVVGEPKEGLATPSSELAEENENEGTFELKWMNISDALKLDKLYPIPVKNYLRDMDHDAHKS